MSFNFAKRLWPSRSINHRSNRRPRPSRLSLEHLEDRLVPSASIATPDVVIDPLPGSPGGAINPAIGPQAGYTPAQIRQAYDFNQISFRNGTIAGDGAGQTIAIIDAYNDPNIANDVDTFDKAFGLTSSSPSLYQQYGGSSSFLSVVNQSGGSSLPGVASNINWEAEESLDVEWAHAMAPGAKIVLVEANSNNSPDLYAAASWAASQPGVSVVSMSFGSNYSGEPTSDSNFYNPYVTFVAAAGDNGTFLYPASSGSVLGVGGTNLSTDASGNYVSESVWSNSGGGSDPNEPGKAGPDVTYNAVNYSFYDSYQQSGWMTADGTSFGAPQWSAIVAIADQGRALDGLQPLASTTTNYLVHDMPGFDFHQNIPGSNEYGDSGAAAIGVGSPYANRVVAGLTQEITATGTRFEVQPGQSSYNILATFQDFTEPGYDLSAIVNLGDGTTVYCPIVNLGNGQYQVSSSYTYSNPGTYTISVEIRGLESNATTVTSTAGVSSYTANQRFVEGLYNDFLSHSAVSDPGGWAYWTAEVPVIGRWQVAYDIAHSTEALDRDVNEIYEAYLGRAADPGGEGYFVSLLQHGYTEEYVMGQILASGEFWQKNGSSNTGFVESLYKDVLHRSASSAEIQGWVNALNGGQLNRTQVADDFVTSSEFRGDAVQTLYGVNAGSSYQFLPNLLQRYQESQGVSQAEISSWVNSGLDLLSIEVDFAASQEYYGVARS